MASVFMTGFDHDHYDIKPEESPSPRKQKLAKKSKYELALEMRAARAEAARQFKEKKLAELKSRASLGYVPIGYYAGMPFQPGLSVWELVAPPTEENPVPRSMRRPAMRARIPLTLLVSAESMVVLETSPETGALQAWNTARRRTWREQFLARCIEASPMPGVPDPVVAVMKMKRFSDPRKSGTTVLTASELEDKLRAPPDQCVIQQFIKAKGVKPNTYRVVWRPHKPCYALNVVNNMHFIADAREAEAKHQQRHQAQQRVQAQQAKAHAQAQAKKDADQAALEDSPGSGGAGAGEVEEAEEDPAAAAAAALAAAQAATTTPKHVHRSVGNLHPLTVHNCASSDHPESITVLRIAGRALEEAEAVIGHVADYLARIFSTTAQMKLTLSEVALDFIKDDNDTWWLTHFKSFCLTDESYKALKSGGRSDGAGNMGAFDSDDEDGGGGAGEANFFASKKKGKLIKGRQCYFCKLRYVSTELVDIDALAAVNEDEAAAASSTGRFNSKAAMRAYARAAAGAGKGAGKGAGAGAGVGSDTQESKGANPNAADAKARQPTGPELDTDIGISGALMGFTESEEAAMKPAEYETASDMIGYTMTRNMMSTTIEALRLRGKSIDCYQHVASMHPSVVYSRYHQYCVCRLCYEVYTSQVKLQETANALAAALCIPSNLDPILCGKRHLSATAMQEDLSLDNRDGQHGVGNKPQFHPLMTRVPTAELPPDACQYRMVFFIRHLEDTPNPKHVPHDLAHCDLKYTLLEHTHSIPVSFKPTGKSAAAGLSPIKAVRVHYLVASPQALMDFLGTMMVTLHLVCSHDAAIDDQIPDQDGIFNRQQHPPAHAPHRFGARQEGRSFVHFTKFLSAGRMLAQAKHDLILPLETRRLGTLGLALSIGIVKDPAAHMPLKEVYATGTNPGVFFPRESYHDCSALPQAWVGTFTAATAASGSPRNRSRPGTPKHGSPLRGFRGKNSPADRVSALRGRAMGASESAPAISAHDYDEHGHMVRPKLRRINTAATALTVVDSSTFKTLQTQPLSPPMEDMEAERQTYQPPARRAGASNRSGAQRTGRPAHRAPAYLRSRAQDLWYLVACHIRGGSFRKDGIARGGTLGRPVERSALLTSVRKLLRGAEWLRAAAALAAVVRMSDDHDNSHRNRGTSSTLRVSTETGEELTWADLNKVLQRPDIVGDHGESIIRKGYQEHILNSIFNQAETETHGIVEVGELRSHMVSLAMIPPEPIVSSTRHGAVSIAQLQHFCAILVNHAKLIQLFQDFDRDATGFITYPDFVALATAAFAECREPGHPLSGVRAGECGIHGHCELFVSDGFCCECEALAMLNQEDLLPDPSDLDEHGPTRVTANTAWLTAWAIEPPEDPDAPFAGPAAELLRPKHNKKGRAGGPDSPARLTRGASQRRVADAMSQGKPSSVPKLRVLTLALRAKKMLQTRLANIRKRNEALREQTKKPSMADMVSAMAAVGKTPRAESSAEQKQDQETAIAKSVVSRLRSRPASAAADRPVTTVKTRKKRPQSAADGGRRSSARLPIDRRRASLPAWPSDSLRATAHNATTAAVLAGRVVTASDMHSGMGYDDGIPWPDANQLIEDAQRRTQAAQMSWAQTREDKEAPGIQAADARILHHEVQRQAQLGQLVAKLEQSKLEQSKSAVALEGLLYKVKYDMSMLGMDTGDDDGTGNSSTNSSAQWAVRTPSTSVDVSRRPQSRRPSARRSQSQGTLVAVPSGSTRNGVLLVHPSHSRPSAGQQQLATAAPAAKGGTSRQSKQSQRHKHKQHKKAGGGRSSSNSRRRGSMGGSDVYRRTGSHSRGALRRSNSSRHNVHAATVLGGGAGVGGIVLL